MAGKRKTTEWILLSENPDEVLSALERGETDGIVPAASGLMDRFSQFMNEMGIFPILDGFADYRKRKSIPAFLFCNLLIHKALFRLKSLSQIGPFLFTCPDVIRTLGFNMRQIEEGFYSGSEQRPLNVEALGDFFAACSLSDFQTNQKRVLQMLLKQDADLLKEGTLIMDCVEAKIPAGNRGRKEKNLECCVVSAPSQNELLPLLWNFIPAKSKADINQGKEILEEILSIAGSDVKRLIVDRGFISGPWMSELKERGIDTVIGLKKDMSLYADMLGLTRCRDTQWLEVAVPKRKNKPVSRHITYMTDLETWDSCSVPLAGIVIKDTYADKVDYQVVVTTDLTANAQQIHAWIRSRWGIEETFMEESRYGCFNNLSPCREAVGAAIIHFSLLAYTLIRLFMRQEKIEKKAGRPSLPSAGIELVAYWREYYAIIYPSELIEIIARCSPQWGDKLPAIVTRLQAFERRL